MQRSATLAAVVWATLAVIPIAGCAGPRAREGSEHDDNGGFQFPEDADPALAEQPFVANELLARSLPGAAAEDLLTAYSDVGATVVQDLPEIQTTVLRVASTELVKVAEQLSTNPLLEAVQKSYVYDPEKTPDDPRFSSQTYLNVINLIAAWEITTGTEDVVIAVLDSGIAPHHPDLADKLVSGWNTFDDNGTTVDVHGHGTSVAGVAAAVSDNGEGIAGVSWGSPIMPVRVTNTSGQASSRAIAAGLVWAANHGAKVVNVSFAPLASDRTVARAARYVRNSGGLVFISAGNDGKASPAAGTVNALFVGAVTDSDERALFSTTGPFVDLAAPGTNIETPDQDGRYRRMSGTSFASPIAAGAAALIWSIRPELRPVTVEDILAETAVDLGDTGRDDQFGAGRLDAGKAVATALDVADLIDELPLSVRITAPADHETVSGVIVVRVEAFAGGGLDDAGRLVVDAVLSLDGVPFATDTAPPFKFALNTTVLSPGIHTLTCVAHDAAGKSSRPQSVEIIVGDGAPDDGAGASANDSIDPVVVINYPVAGTTVISRVAIGATLTDNAGLSRVEWRVDGITRETASISGTRAEASFVWNAENAAPGAHTVTVRASDTANNQGSASVSLRKE